MNEHDPILTVDRLNKTYDSGHTALSDVSLTIERGEILALLGPNGAGKTTLISTICGLVRPTSGRVSVGGYDIVDDYRKARSLIGLVPQEITLEPFEKVWDTVRFSRGLFGKRANDAHIERLLKALTLWDKRDAAVMELSGGMKRRVLIAKALAHEPRVLFLDEPTAGVDVELRKEMWAVVAQLRADGVTIILTTHYIEEAEAIADRVGIISGGKILLVEEKGALMKRLGQRQVRIHLAEPVERVPDVLSNHGLERAEDGRSLIYTTLEGGPPLAGLFADLAGAGIVVADVDTRRRSLEDIFVELVHNGNGDAA
ncbi:ABC transporter ATP-binding protein [Acuticoccus sp. M5D2P5]|uniref:ABC transporter ATP-binding protein n=1 Tax=Acuticoccus kalidii TaxID=2910977 RepID=UPI001F197C5D|nr:ABC transporter ATP-binding protein [Acuticoccus kalidii]MCF3934478.1 ABC transporter ATP-binding protein [Acuticoccus kalidii]